MVPSPWSFSYYPWIPKLTSTFSFEILSGSNFAVPSLESRPRDGEGINNHCPPNNDIEWKMTLYPANVPTPPNFYVGDFNAHTVYVIKKLIFFFRSFFFVTSQRRYIYAWTTAVAEDLCYTNNKTRIYQTMLSRWYLTNTIYVQNDFTKNATRLDKCFISVLLGDSQRSFAKFFSRSLFRVLGNPRTSSLTATL